MLSLVLVLGLTACGPQTREITATDMAIIARDLRPSPEESTIPFASSPGE